MNPVDSVDSCGFDWQLVGPLFDCEFEFAFEC